MIGLLADANGPLVQEAEEIVSQTNVIGPVATGTSEVTDLLIPVTNTVQKIGIQWGTVAYYAVGLLFVLLLAFIVYNVIKSKKVVKTK